MLITIKSILICIACFLAGVITKRIFSPKTVGCLHIDTSDPKKDQFLLEINDDMNDIYERKAITLFIDNKEETK